MKLLQLLFCVVFISAVAGAEPTPGTAEAKALSKKAFAEARALGFDNPKAAAPIYEKAITLDPENYEAYRYYVMASTGAAMPENGTDDEKRAARDARSKELIAQYEKLARENPKGAVYQYVLAVLSDYQDPEKSYQHYLRAISIDPKCGPAYDSLSSAAEARGDLKMCSEYARLAVESNPDEPSYWRHYVASFRESDINKGVKLGLEMARKFPAEAASIIGYLAMRVRDEHKSREIYEMLHQKFPRESVGQLGRLFAMYQLENPAKALALANEMVALAPDNKQWPVLRDYAIAVAEAEKLVTQERGAEALQVLEKITLPRYGADRRPLVVTRARAQSAMGNVAEAYTGLVDVCAKTPTDEYYAVATDLGKKLGKSGAQVRTDVLAAQAAAAKPGVPFSLKNYATGKKLSLDDFKGRVVLVNFWYPKCGPCRGEFPFLQAVLEKYKEKGFEILAINGHAAEDDWVLPAIKGWGLDFQPLKGTDEVIKAYKVRGYPSNFLYGADGRIYHTPSVTSTLELQRELELQIEALLADAERSHATQSRRAAD